MCMAGLGGKQNPKWWYSAPEANEDTLEMLLNLVMAILCFSPSCLQSHAFLCISSLSLDLCGNFCYWWAALWSRSFPVWLCSCLLPLLSCLEPAPWLIGAALCCPVFLLCGPAFWWFVQLSLVLDLTMWPRLLWHHMVPSSARDRRAHTHPPLPANHTPWSKTAKYFASVCLHLCVSDKQLKWFTNTHITNSHIHHEHRFKISFRQILALLLDYCYLWKVFICLCLGLKLRREE